MKRWILFVLAGALTACSSSSSGLPPVNDAAQMPAVPGTQASAPSERTVAATREVKGLPGNNAGSLPGNNAGSLPGELLGCILKVPTTGGADCTIAINLAFPSLNNPLAPGFLIPGLHPADLANAYALPSQQPAPTVAIVDAYDDPTAEADLAVYRLTFGLPPCLSLNGCFRKVNETGATWPSPTFDLGWAQEIALDLEMVSAACPTCKILLVETRSNVMQDLGAGVDTAVRLGAKAVSNSYYAAEWSGEIQLDHHFNHPGVAITASSGDEPYAYYPAASPYVTGVGSTSLQGTSNSWNEIVWSYSGRGCSAFERRPAWQPASLCPASRSTVDMVAVGDPSTGVSMFCVCSGGWVVAGGTSVGAPLIAAAYALSGNPTGPSLSYSYPASFREPRPYTGDNVNAGLGSPIGVGGL